MKIELHMIQSFAPSCLNRDDTNAPKDCIFGGSRRARISSQCLKRSIRKAFGAMDLLKAEDRAVRTRLLKERLLGTMKDKPADEAERVAHRIIEASGLVLNEDGTTQYLLFLGDRVINSLADLCLKHWDVLSKAQDGPAPEEGKTKKAQKKQKKDDIPEEIRNEVVELLKGDKAVDLAFFGRMLADMPGNNVDAACQVAHAISTHKVDMEFDFFTAVDDLQPKEDAGAGMMGTVGFNSACFYRYAIVDFEQLKGNLSQDSKLAREAVGAFLRASVQAVPTGKQNTFAARNPPSFTLAVVRKSGAWNLANAFEKPVFPRKEGLVEISVGALDGYFGKLALAYGSKDIMKTPFLSVDGAEKLAHLKERVESLDALVEAVLSALPEA